MAVHTCLLFATVVDIVTSLWVYFGRNLSFPTLAKAMYFPGVLSFAFVDDIGAFLRQIVGTQAVFTSIVYSGAAVVLTYILVYGCVGMGVCLGWTAKSQPTSIPAQNRISIWGFLRAAGEEMGWRCYLLPCLMSHFTPQMALLISGIAWGLFHVAVMILLTKKLKPEHPVRTTVVQCLSCVVSAYPHGWLAIKARLRTILQKMYIPRLCSKILVMVFRLDKKRNILCLYLCCSVLLIVQDKDTEPLRTDCMMVKCKIK